MGSWLQPPVVLSVRFVIRLLCLDLNILNDVMLRVGRDLKAHLIPPPSAMGRDTTH